MYSHLKEVKKEIFADSGEWRTTQASIESGPAQLMVSVRWTC